MGAGANEALPVLKTFTFLNKKGSQNCCSYKIVYLLVILGHHLDELTDFVLILVILFLLLGLGGRSPIANCLHFGSNLGQTRGGGIRLLLFLLLGLLLLHAAGLLAASLDGIELFLKLLLLALEGAPLDDFGGAIRDFAFNCYVSMGYM